MKESYTTKAFRKTVRDKIPGTGGTKMIQTTVEGFRHGLLYVRGPHQRYDSHRVSRGEGFLLPFQGGDGDPLSRAAGRKRHRDAGDRPLRFLHEDRSEKKGVLRYEA